MIIGHPSLPTGLVDRLPIDGGPAPARTAVSIAPVAFHVRPFGILRRRRRANQLAHYCKRPAAGQQSAISTAVVGCDIMQESGRFTVELSPMWIISGMHRSGTSVVARLFFEAGADMGDPARFYRPDKWNPDGYFEQPEIHAVNMPLIHGGWGRLAYIRLPSDAAVLRRAERLRQRIRQTVETYRGKVVKDVRFCLTLPAWMAHGADVSGIVVCLRHPEAAVKSVQKRNRIPRWLAYRLWLSHLPRLMRAAEDLPLHFVRYEHLLNAQTSAPEIGAAFRFAGLDVDQTHLQQLCETIVKREMNHFPTGHRALPRNVERYWSDLLARHREQHLAASTSLTEAH